MRPARGNGGFTLMEVLAAIVLMAIVLPVAMHAISVATNVASTAKNKAEAAILADSLLNEMRTTRMWQSGALSGDFGEDHPQFHWTAELKDWDASTLKELDIRIVWVAA